MYLLYHYSQNSISQSRDPAFCPWCSKNSLRRGQGRGWSEMPDLNPGSITYRLGDLRQFPNLSESQFHEKSTGLQWGGNGRLTLRAWANAHPAGVVEPRCLTRAALFSHLFIWQTPDGDRGWLAPRLPEVFFSPSLPREAKWSPKRARGDCPSHKW